ncbi:Dabb family protein [Pseudonocardia alni]|uniref:Dabb family protein n=1 Tax=Pseudonocardia alni TaxID=33907 RepID=UPI00399C7BD6
MGARAAGRRAASRASAPGRCEGQAGAVESVQPSRPNAPARPGLRPAPPAVPPTRGRQGADLGERPANADYAVVSEFANAEDFRAYLAHPAHLAVPRDHVRSVHGVQFLVADPG